MMLPERIENIAVIHEHSHWPGKPLPKRFVDSPTLVVRDQPTKVIDEGLTLAGGRGLKFPFICIRRIECDPEKDETGVFVIVASFCSADPAYSTMSAQIYCFGKARADSALFGFQCHVVKNIHHLHPPFDN